MFIAWRQAFVISFGLGISLLLIAAAFGLWLGAFLFDRLAQSCLSMRSAARPRLNRRFGELEWERRDRPITSALYS